MNRIGTQEITWADALFAFFLTPPATLLVLGSVYGFLHYVLGMDSRAAWDYVIPVTIFTLIAAGLFFSWRNPASPRLLEHAREWLVVFAIPPALALAMFSIGFWSAEASVLLVQAFYMPIAALFFMFQFMMSMNATSSDREYRPMGPPAEYTSITKTQMLKR
ncbi:MAG: hypothetical protein MUC90_00355 [Thermoplasmata archaeon]|nr:hypothetical protein [Thermoplasmata archaeon]